MTADRRSRALRTRWLLMAPIAGLAAIVAGVVLLEAIHPQADTFGLAVDGVPPLAIEDTRACVRRVDESAVEEIRAELRPDRRITSSQVFACPMAYDGQHVAYAGEVVGEVLVRSGGAWAQVNDDAYALEVGPVIGHREHAGFNTGMSVWLPDGLHERIDAPGRPGRRGDVIVVRGVVLQADPADGGGITLRAEELEVLAAPVEITPPLHVVQVVVAAVLLVVALTSVVWSRRSQRSRR